LACGSGEPEPTPETSDGIQGGVAGGSAQREYERRRDRREQKVLGRHPRIGRLILAVTDDPQSTTAWAQGARGEQQLGASLDANVPSGSVVLHDRRISRSRANIDHIVVAPSGVWVVDAKRYRGRVERRDVGGMLRRDDRLFVNGRDRTSLVAGVERQVDAVCGALARARARSVAVFGVLCFLDADWATFARPFTLARVEVTWPKALIKRITDAATAEIDVENVAQTLDRVFPAAM
jgi:hypothetical protein